MNDEYKIGNRQLKRSLKGSYCSIVFMYIICKAL